MDLRCCAGFSLAVTSEGSSLVVVHTFLLAVASLDIQALLLHSMWDLPGARIEPMSPPLSYQEAPPVLEGEFFTIDSPGKPCSTLDLGCFFVSVSWCCLIMFFKYMCTDVFFLFINYWKEGIKVSNYCGFVYFFFHLHLFFASCIRYTYSGLWPLGKLMHFSSIFILLCLLCY